MSLNECMQNREVSWLRFNERVLEEAQNEEVPLLEKLKFISIFVSNLDEFFMVRVGSLYDLKSLDNEIRDNKSNMIPQEQIDVILEMLPPMYEKKDRFYRNIAKRLEQYNIKQYHYDELDKDQKEYVTEYYKNRLYELISPQIIDMNHPFPFLENKKLYVVTELQAEKRKLFGLIPVRRTFPKFILLPGNGVNYILTEEVILAKTEKIFRGFDVISKHLIKVTRNFDFTDDQEKRDEFEDYKDYMLVVLQKRKRLNPVRLESNGKLSPSVLKFLLKKLKLTEANYLISSTSLTMNYIFELLDYVEKDTKDLLMYQPYEAFRPYKKQSIIEQIRKRDFILNYPFDDMDVFIKLIKEAANDPSCVSIKITVYRLAKNSKVVKYLCQAAENGKEVTVFVELKARFDEESNINYSDILYESGCNIIYGFRDYKTHSKLFLLTFRDEQETLSYITQVGTGNYNESTSRLYTDLSLFTAKHEIGQDASQFFKNMAIGKLDGEYRYLLQAPTSLKQTFLQLMDREIEKGEDGYIFAKFNSLTDKDFIVKFVEASREGVKIQLMIRGISCMLPGVEGDTENVEIRSIVGRFLEHSRVYIFGKAPKDDIYISSADMMTRNMDRRVEIAAPILDEKLKEYLRTYAINLYRDNLKGRRMGSNGEYQRIEITDEVFSSQDFYVEECDRKRKEEKRLKALEKESPKKESLWERIVRVFHHN